MHLHIPLLLLVYMCDEEAGVDDANEDKECGCYSIWYSRFYDDYS